MLAGGHLYVPPSVFRTNVAGLANFGENIAWGNGSAASTVDKWYSEIQYTDNGQVTSWSPVVRHYTQLVWKDSQVLGCAKNRHLIVCHYGPQGNDAAALAKQVLPPIRSRASCEEAEKTSKLVSSEPYSELSESRPTAGDSFNVSAPQLANITKESSSQTLSGFAEKARESLNNTAATLGTEFASPSSATVMASMNKELNHKSQRNAQESTALVRPSQVHANETDAKTISLLHNAKAPLFKDKTETARLGEAPILKSQVAQVGVVFGEEHQREPAATKELAQLAEARAADLMKRAKRAKEEGRLDDAITHAKRAKAEAEEAERLRLKLSALGKAAHLFNDSFEPFNTNNAPVAMAETSVGEKSVSAQASERRAPRRTTKLARMTEASRMSKSTRSGVRRYVSKTTRPGVEFTGNLEAQAVQARAKAVALRSQLQTVTQRLAETEALQAAMGSKHVRSFQIAKDKDNEENDGQEIEIEDRFPSVTERFPQTADLNAAAMVSVMESPSANEYFKASRRMKGRMDKRRKDWLAAANREQVLVDEPTNPYADSSIAFRRSEHQPSRGALGPIDGAITSLKSRQGGLAKRLERELERELRLRENIRVATQQGRSEAFTQSMPRTTLAIMGSMGEKGTATKEQGGADVLENQGGEMEE
eukprot:TRINITY_DN6330_c1_g2_i1.p1 TRINITY_DN6330_c1_g2~~TRINITY_DN6330_c1_g2_i1.p1  ORF type:complete len:677 (+),score=113.02 TRINITY_DN6330_c1_g2_i1:77-2032(+)